MLDPNSLLYLLLYQSTITHVLLHFTHALPCLPSMLCLFQESNHHHVLIWPFESEYSTVLKAASWSCTVSDCHMTTGGSCSSFQPPGCILTTVSFTPITPLFSHFVYSLPFLLQVIIQCQQPCRLSIIQLHYTHPLQRENCGKNPFEVLQPSTTTFQSEYFSLKSFSLIAVSK